MFKKIFLCSSLFYLSFLKACPDAKNIAYPKAANYVDSEINALLSQAEHLMFAGEFKEALFQVERAESLIFLTIDPDRYRTLRILFDKALMNACLDRSSDEIRESFLKFESLLVTKCSSKSEKNLFDDKGHWPILGPDVMPKQDCLDAVDNTVALAMIAITKLPINKGAAIAIETAIYAIGKKARACCTENGFWKTCLQPVVDVWKKMDVLKTPPDPYWD